MISSSCRCRAYSILLLCLCLTTLVIPLLYHAVSDLPSNDGLEGDITLESFHRLADKDQLLHHLDDMYRLQRSVNLELSKLEQRRKLLKEEVNKLESKKDILQKELAGHERAIKQYQVNIENLLMKRAETGLDYPSVSLPLQLPPENYIKPVTPTTSCTFSTCFDFSRCSVLSPFSVFIYDLPSSNNLSLLWKSSLSKSVYASKDAEHACLYVAIIDETTNAATLSQQLSYWHGDGRNHLIINFSPHKLDLSKSRAMAALSDYRVNDLRSGFDFLLPHIPKVYLSWQQLPLLLPVRKDIMASYVGTVPIIDISEAETIFIQAFKDLHSPPKASITTNCIKSEGCNQNEWCLCQDKSVNHASTFDLIPNTRYIPFNQLTIRLYIALSRGSVPVILGSYHSLPLHDSISWTKAAILLPKQRVTEVIYILRNILEPDIMILKKEGRRLFDSHLSSVDMISLTLLTSIRQHIVIPAAALSPIESQLIYNEDHPMPLFEPHVESKDEILGPVEEPFPSPIYQRNFSLLLHDGGNSPDSGAFLYPHTPWDPVLPTDAKYHGR